MIPKCPLRFLIYFTSVFNIDITAICIVGINNEAADMLSKIRQSTSGQHILMHLSFQHYYQSYPHASQFLTLTLNKACHPAQTGLDASIFPAPLLRSSINYTGDSKTHHTLHLEHLLFISPYYALIFIHKGSIYGILHSNAHQCATEQ